MDLECVKRLQYCVVNFVASVSCSGKYRINYFVKVRNIAVNQWIESHYEIAVHDMTEYSEWRYTATHSWYLIEWSASCSRWRSYSQKKKSDVSTTVENGIVEDTSTAVQHTSTLGYTW
jgi:hypothetical protein